MVTNGQRGAIFEREVRADLTRRGYVVSRSTASKTPLDLMALWSDMGRDPEWPTGADGTTSVPPGYWLPAALVQAKLDGRLDPGEWNVLYNLACSSETVAVLASRVRQGRRNTIAYHVLTDRKISGQRHPPMVHIHPPEAPL